MATTDILPFATGASALVLSQSAYSALPAQTNGFQAGIADPATLNKVWRQSSFMAAGLANLLVARGVNVPDDGNLTNLVSNLGSVIAPLASPSFTGTPTAPTTAVDTNTTQLATTAFVLGQAGSASPTMNGTATVGMSTRFARQDHVHPTDASRAPLLSPAFTGTPTAPTAAAATNNTQIATTAFVTTAVSNATPAASATVAGVVELATATEAQAGTDTARAVTPAGLASALGLAAPPGTVTYFARNTAPSGWLKANGALVSRTTYANLFAAIGTAFGAGDGTTTFALPDLRGEFVRGWDDGRGVDAARAFGSGQLDAFQGHMHGKGFVNTTATTSTALDVQLGPNSATSGTVSAGVLSDGTNGTPRNAPETRPRNIALLACIKY